MAYTEIVITRFGDHLVSMLLKDGHPVEFQCVSEKNKVDIGNIYIGVVKNVVKNINGAFVEFDQDEIGFLSMRHRQYKAGDEVLVQVAQLLQRHLRRSDSISRYGGEEFLVLLADGDLVLTQGAGNVGALSRTLADLRLNVDAMTQNG